MNIKNVILATMLMSFASCNARNSATDKLIEFAAEAVAVCALYTAYHVYQADGNWHKAKRLMRKTNDQAITAALDIMKKISQRLEQCKTTSLQKIADTIAEGVEEAAKAKNCITTIKLQKEYIPQKISIVSDDNRTTIYIRT